MCLAYENVFDVIIIVVLAILLYYEDILSNSISRL